MERHITLDRTMYGSDQSLSLEPNGFKKMVSYIRAIEQSFGSYDKIISEKEKETSKKLRRVDNI